MVKKNLAYVKFDQGAQGKQCLETLEVERLWFRKSARPSSKRIFPSWPTFVGAIFGQCISQISVKISSYIVSLA